jgi:hypothetical protein
MTRCVDNVNLSPKDKKIMKKTQPRRGEEKAKKIEVIVNQ